MKASTTRILGAMPPSVQLILSHSFASVMVAHGLEALYLKTLEATEGSNGRAASVVTSAIFLDLIADLARDNEELCTVIAHHITKHLQQQVQEHGK